jgi:hypothetical protein
MANDSGGLTGTDSRTITIYSTAAVLVGAGDIASCEYEQDEETASLLDNIAGTIFTVGDNAYPDGTDEQFTNCFGPTWGRHKSRIRPSPGNHEYHVLGASGYFNYFGAAAGEADKGYYSYDIGGWHIIALNSECSAVGGCGSNSPQGLWLQADLAANPSPCTIAYWHQPRFSSGTRHGGDTDMRPFWQLLYNAGADIVLNGHEHNYERFAPQDPNGAGDSQHGIRQFIVGTGGSDLYNFGIMQPNSDVRNSDTHGVLKLTLYPGSYAWEFIPIAGQAFTDSGSANCVSPPPVPPMNQAPAVSAGPDQTIILPAGASLDGTVTDDGQPNPPGTVITTWSQVNGPGTVTFGNASAVDTTASFSSLGTYVLRLTANDGILSVSDDVIVDVLQQAGGVTTQELRIESYTDDAEESPTGTVSRTGTDLELVYDLGNQTVGIRFTRVSIPRGATIVNAYVQFKVDETTSTPTALTIQGQAGDNSPTFTTTAWDISSRSRTTASVAWSPAPWTTVGAVGLDKRTPNLAPIVQEVVNRTGWATGSSLVLIITGTGERVARASDGDAAGAPLLHVEYTTGG